MDRVDRLAERLLAECELTEDHAYIIADFIVDELPRDCLASLEPIVSICVGAALHKLRIEGGWRLRGLPTGRELTIQRLVNGNVEECLLVVSILRGYLGDIKLSKISPIASWQS